MPPATKEKLRILVVDDDRDLAKGFEDLLVSEGFEVHCEYNGKAAIEHFRERYYDLAFVDGLLPGMDGFKLCSEMRWVKHGERMPIIMISGVYRASSHGNDAINKYRLADYLEKPITPQVVIDTLRRIFAKNYPRPAVEEHARQSGATEGAVEAVQAGPSRRRIVNTYYLWDASKMPLVGNLNETPYPLLLAEIARRALTGYVTLTFEQVKKAIAFEKGRPVSVSSNIVGECLGQMLLREGLISKEVLDTSLNHMREHRLRQGDVLVRMKAITPHDLQEALNRQFMVKLFSVFSWTNARYTFAPATDPVRVLNAPTLSPFALLRDGLMTQTPEDFPLTWLKPYRTSIVGVNEGAEALLRESGFTLKEIRRLTALTGKENLEDLLRSSALSSREMALLLLAAVIIGAVHVEQPINDKNSESGRIGMEDVFLGIDENNLLQAHVRFHMEQAKAQSSANKPATPPPAKAAELQSEARSKMEMVELMQVMQRLTTEQQAIYKRLFDKRTELRKVNFFQRLGVDQTAPIDAIKKSFRELAKTHHPDTVPSKEVPEIRMIADEVFSLFTKAHETLTTPDLRKPYIDQLNGASQQDATAEVARILAAEQYFHEGQQSVKRKDWVNAQRQIEEAIKLHPEDGSFYCELGWVLFNLSPNDMVSRQTAFKNLNKGLEMQPRNADAHFYIGSIHKSAGDLVKAAEAYLEALKIDSKHARARSEVHLLKMRKQENDKAKNAGFLGGLFKKKS